MDVCKLSMLPLIDVFDNKLKAIIFKHTSSYSEIFWTHYKLVELHYFYSRYHLLGKDVIVAKSFLHFTKAPKVYSVSSKEMETIIWYPSLSGFIRQQTLGVRFLLHTKRVFRGREFLSLGAGRYLKNFYVIRKGVIPIDNEIFSRDICGKKQRCADVREGFYDPCGNEDTYFCKEYKASDFPAVILELPLTILELELPSEKTE
uniref:Uncharacterized protein n=1 Tax=Rhizophagus irregularis (strain DAOM 181602 / DAOM 197198 / MUCL 43194) TaxID=747089 RepID=U9T0U2_RHIID